MIKYHIIAYKESEGISDLWNGYSEYIASNFELNTTHIDLSFEQAVIKVADLLYDNSELQIHIIKTDDGNSNLYYNIMWNTDHYPSDIISIKEESLKIKADRIEEEKRIKKEKKRLAAQKSKIKKQEKAKRTAEKKIADDLALLKRLQEIYGKDAV